ncbi:hypothetical protein C6Y62_00720 [Hyphomicrobium sulfonivorans]|nr:glycosyltransferase [Hyphomicrobium sulfonivorans]NSL70343.1 hypothetical protein [Hyphomicrobium sulfonivorans]
MKAASVVEAVSKRIAFVCPGLGAIQNFRTLLAELVARGHRAFVLSPELQKAEADELAKLGVEHAVIGAEDSGWKLLSDWKAVGAIRQQLTRWGADVAVASGGRTMIYGALAAKRAHIARAVVIVGALPEHRFTGTLAENEMPAWRYGQALRSADVALFHNGEDIALLKRLGIVPEGLPVSLTAGADVDLETYPVKPLPPITQGIGFLMVAGLDVRRGVEDYCAAASLLRQRSPNARFLLAALPDDDADAQTVDPALLASSREIEFLGVLDDRAEADLLEQAHVFVYPARLAGMPQPVLNALATGRPIITSAVPGCREAVDDQVNGRLVPARDVEALAEAMGNFLRRPDRIPAMALASRAKAEQLASLTDVRFTVMEALALDDT